MGVGAGVGKRVEVGKAVGDGAEVGVDTAIAVGSGVADGAVVGVGRGVKIGRTVAGGVAVDVGTGVGVTAMLQAIAEQNNSQQTDYRMSFCKQSTSHLSGAPARQRRPPLTAPR